MSKDYMNYGALVQDALRGVVKQALIRVAAQGLPGHHHLYISFKTHAAGVDIPDHLRERYPDEMTIVLQHQYWGLKVEEHQFEVQLSFNKIPERLLIPFSALSGFFDPSVQFGLQFQPSGEAERAAEQPAAFPAPKAETPEEKPKPAEEKRGEVLTLDAFRKK